MPTIDYATFTNVVNDNPSGWSGELTGSGSGVWNYGITSFGTLVTGTPVIDSIPEHAVMDAAYVVITASGSAGSNDVGVNIGPFTVGEFIPELTGESFSGTSIQQLFGSGSFSALEGLTIGFSVGAGGSEGASGVSLSATVSDYRLRVEYHIENAPIINFTTTSQP